MHALPPSFASANHLDDERNIEVNKRTDVRRPIVSAKVGEEANLLALASDSLNGFSFPLCVCRQN